MEYIVQVTRKQISRSHKKVQAGSMIEAKAIIETQLRNGDYNPGNWVMLPTEDEVVPLSS